MTNRTLLYLVVLPLLALLLSGCYLRVMLPSVEVEELDDEIALINASIESGATVAVCQLNEFWNQAAVECTYIIGGESQTSTPYLFSNLGILGWIIDPLILQVPDDVTVGGATVDDGNGSRPLRLRSGLTSLPVEPNKELVAEAGQQLVLLELPIDLESRLPEGDPADGMELSFGLNLERTVQGGETRSIPVKMIAAGRVLVNGRFYYIPFLPCVTDFAEMPAVELSETSGDLLPVLTSLLGQNTDFTCDLDVYDLNDAPPPAHRLNLPEVLSNRTGRSLAR